MNSGVTKTHMPTPGMGVQVKKIPQGGFLGALWCRSLGENPFDSLDHCGHPAVVARGSVPSGVFFLTLFTEVFLVVPMDLSGQFFVRVISHAAGTPGTATRFC